MHENYQENSLDGMFKMQQEASEESNQKVERTRQEGIKR